jgi:tRNA threonylcarbamoyladenosine biosynthesis protein TsaB
MRILSVDTSSERGSVCVAEDQDILGEVRLASSIQHSERLFRSVEFLFHHLPFQLADIDLFVAARGPGSFTGLRIGLAAMEGFVTAHRRRGAGITTLEALAWKTGIRNALVAPIIDARRGEVYGAIYRRSNDTLVEERPAIVLKPAEWFASLPREPLIFCGDGAIRHRVTIEENHDWSIHAMDLYLASTIAELATTPNCGPLAPLYVRKTDAEIIREDITNQDS